MNVSETFRPRDMVLKRFMHFSEKYYCATGFGRNYSTGLTYPFMNSCIAEHNMRKSLCLMFASDVEVEAIFRQIKKMLSCFRIIEYSFLVSQNAWQYNYLKCQYKRIPLFITMGLISLRKKRRLESLYSLGFKGRRNEAAYSGHKSCEGYAKN
jgi:hypothetical protein